MTQPSHASVELQAGDSQAQPRLTRAPSVSRSVHFHLDADDGSVIDTDAAVVGRVTRSPSLSHKRPITIDHPDYHHNQPGPHLKPLSPPAMLHEQEVHPVPEHPPTPSSPTQVSAAATPVQPQRQMAEKSQADAPLAKYQQVKAIANLQHGLSEALVLKQREEHGFNETVEKPRALWKVFLSKFTNATSLMILAAMAVAFGLKEWINASVIAVLLLVNGLIAFREDLKARKALQQLMGKLQVMARVQRDGEWAEIPARELVPGDLVRLRTGDIGGADIVLLNGDLSVDQSALTGETALKSLKRGGMVFAGAIVKRGEANGIVVAIGSQTYFGQTAKLVQSSQPSPHIEYILKRIIGILMTLIVILITVTLIILGIRGDDIIEVIPLLLMVLVTALPVALPVMFNVSLALGSSELARRSILITRLNVLEDAAMMSILFSDKTGTLTKNHLTIKETVPLKDGVTVSEVLFTAALCSRKENSDPIDRACLEAQALERANRQLASAEARSEIYPDQALASYEPLHFVPFDASNRRTEATVQHVSASRDGQPLVLRASKGAVATLCALSGLSPDSAAWRAIDERVEAFAAKGYRTLAVGYQLGAGAREGEAPPAVDSKFELLGLIALFDPPRPDSRAILARLAALGVETKMLTGDAVGVANETGRALGMGTRFVNLEHEKHRLVEEWARSETKIQIAAKEEKQAAAAQTTGARRKGKDAPKSAAEALEARVMQHLLDEHDPLQLSGFAQIFPADKHYIVSHTQKKGLICGMTGDGVNDAPSLKQAEVGCAVSNATDVAKGSASGILLNEGLSGVIDLVEVGRQVHRRVEVWTINKIAKASQHSVFILVLFLILGRFPLSALGVVVLLLLMDFVLVSLATDRQMAGGKPATWNLARLTRIGLTVGLPGAGQMMCLLLVTDHFDVFTERESQTFAFELMFLWGFFSVFAVREKSWFFTSRPSAIMAWICLAETILVWIVVAVGVPGFDGIGWAWSSMTIGFALVCFVVNDAIKVMYIRTFEREFIDEKFHEMTVEEKADQTAHEPQPTGESQIQVPVQQL